MPTILCYTNPEICVRTDLPKVEGRDQLELTEKCSYIIQGDLIKPDGYPKLHYIVIPKGYIFDGASIPRALWSFASPVNDWLAGAVLHDWAYYTHAITREAADDLLLQVVRKEGHSRAYCWAVRCAVRGFGKAAYIEGDHIAAREEMAALGGSTPWRDPHWQAESWSELTDYPGAAE